MKSWKIKFLYLLERVFYVAYIPIRVPPASNDTPQPQVSIFNIFKFSLDRRAFYSSCPFLIHSATDLKHDLPQHFRKQLQFNLIKSTLNVHFH